VRLRGVVAVLRQLRRVVALLSLVRLPGGVAEELIANRRYCPQKVLAFLSRIPYTRSWVSTAICLKILSKAITHLNRHLM